MTVTKLLTGQDAPVSNLEIVLTGTYYKAKERLRIQQERASGHKSGRRGRR